MGIDPAGNKLHVAMPRFRMSLQDMEDLAAYPDAQIGAAARHKGGAFLAAGHG